MRYKATRILHYSWRCFCNQSVVQQKSTDPAIVAAEPNYLYVGFIKRPFSVEPDLDFRKRLSDLDSLRRLLELRGYNVENSFGDLRLLSEKYHQWFQCAPVYYQTYSRERTEQLRQNVDSEEYKQFVEASEKLAELERECIWTCLRLPADLHPWTPTDGKPKRLATFQHGKPVENDQTDLETGSSRHHLGLMVSKSAKHPEIEFKNNPPQCFLSGRVAHLLRSLERYFTTSLYAAGYRSFSPAHFIRSPIVEAYFGSTHPDGSNSPYLLPVECIHSEKGEDQTWALNLGGHGPTAYLALFSRKIMGRKNAFPLKFSSIGMSYSGNIKSTGMEGWNLFNFPVQRPRVSNFAIYEKESDSEMATQVANTVQDLLCKLKLSFSVDQKPSNQLLMPEMSRMDISSNSIRLASISSYGDYLSKRVRLMADQIPGKNEDQLANAYERCCYADVDLYNVLAKIYEELHPSGDMKGDLGVDWWPEVLRPFT